VYGLASQGAEVCVVARNASKAILIASQFGTAHASWDELKSLRWDLLVNATPVGTYPNDEESPVRSDWLNGEWVYDLVYNPKETRLLREASRRGCKVIHGSEMLLAQAISQQSLWFGTPPPEDVMQVALDQALSMRRTRADDRSGPQVRHGAANAAHGR